LSDKFAIVPMINHWIISGKFIQNSILFINTIKELYKSGLN